jgi:hypothetical protein
MLQCVIAAYQRITSFPNWSFGTRFFRTAARRRTVLLNVLVLEERATPAGTDSFLPPIHPPEAVLVAPIPAVSIPAQPPVDNGSAANASVRSANDLEEMLANERASKEDAAGEPQAHRQATDAATWANDTSAAETVVIEDMMYLPRVD